MWGGTARPHVSTDGAGNWVAVWGSVDRLDGSASSDVGDIFFATATGLCGDGSIGGGEQCDDGDSMVGDGCDPNLSGRGWILLPDTGQSLRAVHLLFRR